MLVEAWPGFSRQSLAPSCFASSWPPRSVFSIPIWLEGRQNASDAESLRYAMTLGELDHAADPVLGLHQLEAAVDLVEADAVGDEGVRSISPAR